MQVPTQSSAARRPGLRGSAGTGAPRLADPTPHPHRGALTQQALPPGETEGVLQDLLGPAPENVPECVLVLGERSRLCSSRNPDASELVPRPPSEGSALMDRKGSPSPPSKSRDSISLPLPLPSLFPVTGGPLCPRPCVGPRDTEAGPALPRAPGGYAVAAAEPAERWEPHVGRGRGGLPGPQLRSSRGAGQGFGGKSGGERNAGSRATGRVGSWSATGDREGLERSLWLKRGRWGPVRSDPPIRARAEGWGRGAGGRGNLEGQCGRCEGPAGHPGALDGWTGCLPVGVRSLPSPHCGAPSSAHSPGDSPFQGWPQLQRPPGPRSQ